MRSLIKSERHELKIIDKIGGDLVLFYRMPDYTERARYENSLYIFKANKLTLIPTTRVKFGKEIITGIGDNCFSDENGAISSDPEGSNYREDWKDLIEDQAPELLAQLAFYVFENTKIAERLEAAKDPEGIALSVDDNKEGKPDFFVKK